MEPVSRSISPFQGAGQGQGAPWVPCPSQQWKRAARTGATRTGTPPCETLFVLAVTEALRRRVSGAT